MVFVMVEWEITAILDMTGILSLLASSLLRGITTVKLYMLTSVRTHPINSITLINENMVKFLSCFLIIIKHHIYKLFLSSCLVTFSCIYD